MVAFPVGFYRDHKFLHTVKYIAWLLLLVLTLTGAHPALAAFCQQSKDHQICILTIERSAKYYWEYRAVVSVDGVKQPIEIYNCRDRLKIQKDRTTVPFEPQGAGELICRFFKQ